MDSEALCQYSPQTLQNINKIEIFADDTSTVKNEKGNCNMQNDLDKLCEWFYYNILSNTSKCETMSFGIARQKSVENS